MIFFTYQLITYQPITYLLQFVLLKLCQRHVYTEEYGPVQRRDYGALYEVAAVIVRIPVPENIVLVSDIIYAQIKYREPLAKTMQISYSKGNIIKVGCPVA